MIVKLFEPKFHDMVASGLKLQTIRAMPKNAKYIPQVGADISLRKWTGVPYRSSQEELTRGEIVQVCPVVIMSDRVRLSLSEYRWLKSDVELNEFAKAEGFNDWTKMWHSLAWFRGMLLRWSIIDPSSKPKQEELAI